MNKAYVLTWLLLLWALPCRADVSPQLSLEASVGGEIHRTMVDSYLNNLTGGSFHVGVFMPWLATLDIGLRGSIYSTLASQTSIGSSLDGLVRWFPLTYSRNPDFSAGVQHVQFRYALMPFVGGGLGLNLISATAADQSQILSVMPRVLAFIGTYVPFSQKVALLLEADAAYGQTIKKGGAKVQDTAANFAAGIAVFL